MRTPASEPSEAPARLLAPQVKLFGEINDDFFRSFREQIGCVTDDDITVELTTFGGDADVGRRVREDLRILTEHCGKTLWFAGRTTVYSAGVTIMSAFPVARRFLSRGCVLLIHERTMNKDVSLRSALKASALEVDRVKAEIEVALEVERRGFRDLVAGSEVSFEEICERAVRDWYVTADEALERKLIAGLF
ncbi:MAG TPA: peptidase S14 [Vitreimonas sp.]|uniref:peptidase S14 n=1 Tax=Vitreimonas sp. TaxID=3069702 RepID=UPI002D630D05|nr:peptidase S14 [Vitreimonas sp.]HYD87250.1 peptidase S14 [Vitreimonas sp.]